MHIHCNAGIVVVKTVGDLPGYGTVWFYPGGIANILSLARVQTHCQVTYDSSNDNQFTVHKEHMRNLKRSAQGRYYCCRLNTSPSPREA